jgi:hypothetical protein
MVKSSSVAPATRIKQADVAPIKKWESKYGNRTLFGRFAKETKKAIGDVLRGKTRAVRLQERREALELARTKQELERMSLEAKEKEEEEPNDCTCVACFREKMEEEEPAVKKIGSIFDQLKMTEKNKEEEEENESVDVLMYKTPSAKKGGGKFFGEEENPLEEEKETLLQVKRGGGRKLEFDESDKETVVDLTHEEFMQEMFPEEKEEPEVIEVVVLI